MSIEAIKEALAAGPTEGNWQAIEKSDPDPSEGTHWIYCDGYGALGYWRGHKHDHQDSNWILNEADAKLIAACNPVAIRSLIERLEAAEKDAARYRGLRDSKAGDWVICAWDETDCRYFQDLRAPSVVDAAIDSAMEAGK